MRSDRAFGTLVMGGTQVWFGFDLLHSMPMTIV